MCWRALSAPTPNRRRLDWPALGRARYDAVLRLARARRPVVAAGEFAADTRLSLVNDGPLRMPLRIS